MSKRERRTKDQIDTDRINTYVSFLESKGYTVNFGEEKTIQIQEVKEPQGFTVDLQINEGDLRSLRDKVHNLSIVIKKGKESNRGHKVRKLNEVVQSLSGYINRFIR